MGTKRLRSLNQCIGPVDTINRESLDRGVKTNTTHGSSLTASLRSRVRSSLGSKSHEVLDLTESGTSVPLLNPKRGVSRSSDRTAPGVIYQEEWNMSLDFDKKRPKKHKPPDLPPATPRRRGIPTSDFRKTDSITRTRKTESPDALALEPPPAKIVSDLPQVSLGRKSVLPSRISDEKSPYFKRHGASSSTQAFESEDELGTDPKRWGKRDTNFTHVDTHRQMRTRSRDIGTSESTSSRLARSLNKFEVIQAACGNHVYQSRGKAPIRLQLTGMEKPQLVPVTATSQMVEGLDWMCIVVDSIQKLEFHETDSSNAFVRIDRPATQTAPGTLFLELTSSRYSQSLLGLSAKFPSLPRIVKRAIETARARPQYKENGGAAKDALQPTPWRQAGSLEMRNRDARHDVPGRSRSSLDELRPKVKTSASSKVEGAKDSKVERPKVESVRDSKLERAQDSTVQRPKVESVKDSKLEKARDSEVESPKVESIRDSKVESVKKSQQARPTSSGAALASPISSKPPSLTYSLLRTTRRTRQSSPPPAKRQCTPESWTLQNPDWQKMWQSSLVFPATGKNRATVDADDIVRLDEGQLLNDNLLAFYLRYLQHNLEIQGSEAGSKVHIFSTFFYEKLRSTRGKINYEGVKSWTAKIDLFSYDYIIVPVNERSHWYLAIICNLPNTLKSCTEVDVEDDGKDTIDTTQPRIITLDSLGLPRHGTCRFLKEYLIEEARHKKGVDLVTIPNGMTAKELPQQGNGSDCGVYLLAYTEQFLNDPEQCCRKLFQREDLEWKVDASQLRTDMRTLILRLQQEQQQARLTHVKPRKSAPPTGAQVYGHKQAQGGHPSPAEGEESQTVSKSAPEPKSPDDFESDKPLDRAKSPREVESSDRSESPEDSEGWFRVKTFNPDGLLGYVVPPRAVEESNRVKPPEAVASLDPVKSPRVDEFESRDGVKSPRASVEGSDRVKSPGAVKSFNKTKHFDDNSLSGTKLLHTSASDTVNASGTHSSIGIQAAFAGAGTSTPSTNTTRPLEVKSRAWPDSRAESTAQAASVLADGRGKKVDGRGKNAYGDVEFISCLKSSSSPSTDSQVSFYHSAQSSPIRELHADGAGTTSKPAGTKEEARVRGLPAMTLEEGNAWYRVKTRHDVGESNLDTKKAKSSGHQSQLSYEVVKSESEKDTVGKRQSELRHDEESKRRPASFGIPEAKRQRASSGDVRRAIEID